MPHIANIEIRFSDIDKFGHVNNAKYLTFLEQARISYFNTVIGKNNEWQNTGIILAKAEIDFLIPILLDDKIEIEIAITKLGNKSFEISYKIIKNENQKLSIMAIAKTILVCYSYKLNTTIAIPIEWVEKVKLFENF